MKCIALYEFSNTNGVNLNGVICGCSVFEIKSSDVLNYEREFKG